MKRVRLIYVLVVVASIGFLVYQSIKEGLIYQKSVSEVIGGVKPNENVFVYENKESHYRVTLPKEWGVSEAKSSPSFESMMEAIPAYEDSKVTKLDIDVLKPGQEALELSKESEFKMWSNLGIDNRIGDITKLGEAKVSGQKVLILADLTKVGDSVTENGWSILGWFRKDGRNFYVRMFGLQNFEETDKEAFIFLLNTMELE